MDITFLGNSSFRVKGKLASLVTGTNSLELTKIDTEDKKVINGPGEYEINGVSVIGIKSGKTTIYVIEIDGVRILHLGDLNHELEDKETKEIGNIDILFTPALEELRKQISASIVIPIYEKVEDAEEFLKKSGLRTEKLPKLSIKEGAINSEEEYAIILEKK
jgi:hypothetical protein